MRPTSFNKIDFILAASGHLIFPVNRWQRFLRYLLLILAWLRIVASAYRDIADHFVDGIFSLYDVSDTFFWLFCIIFYLYLAKNRRQMARFICFTTRQVGISGLNKLKGLANRILVLFLAYWTFQNLVQTCTFKPYGICQWKVNHVFYLSNQTVESLGTAILVYFSYAYESIFCISWMATATCLYVYVRSLKNAAVVIKMKQLTKLVEGTRGRDFCTEIELVNSISRIQDTFNQAFSMIPFLAFTANFFLMSGYFLYVIYTPHITNDVRISMIGVTAAFIVFPIFFCITSQSQHEIRHLGYDLISKLQKRIMNQNDSQLVTLVERLVQRKESGWLFDLDGATILSFAGHMTSFAVIFLQLMPPRKA